VRTPRPPERSGSPAGSTGTRPTGRWRAAVVGAILCVTVTASGCGRFTLTGPPPRDGAPPAPVAPNPERSPGDAPGAFDLD